MKKKRRTDKVFDVGKFMIPLSLVNNIFDRLDEKQSYCEFDLTLTAKYLRKTDFAEYHPSLILAD